MTADDAARRMIAVLRAENVALAGHDHAAAATLLAEKIAAAALLREAVAQGPTTRALAEALLAASQENNDRLSGAIAVQTRVLDLVARAARRVAPANTQYGRRGVVAAAQGAGAVALQA